MNLKTAKHSLKTRVFILTGWIMTAMTVAVCVCSGVLAQEALLDENFESYAVGGNPPASFNARYGGWNVAEEAGSKFLTCDTGAGANQDIATTQKFPGDVAIEFDTRHSTGALHATITSHYGSSPEGSWSFQLYIHPDRSVQMGYHWADSSYHDGGEIVGTVPFTPQANTWYKVKLALCGTIAKLYIDNEFILEYDISAVVPYTIENFHAIWMTWGRRDLDNVRVAPVTNECPECSEHWQCAQGSGCSENMCVEDTPPAIGSGPFLAAGAWPALPATEANAFVFDQNYYVLWTFDDDYATCDGVCSHRARYQKIGDTAWRYLAPQTDETGKWYAFVELPVDRMADGNYRFVFDLFDCAGQLKTSRSYYFNVVREE